MDEKCVLGQPHHYVGKAVTYNIEALEVILDQHAYMWLAVRNLYHLFDTELTNPYPILIMPSAGLGSEKYQFKSHWFDSTRVWKCEV